MRSKERREPRITEPFFVPDTYADGVVEDVIGATRRLTFYADRPAQYPLTGLERVVVARVVTLIDGAPCLRVIDAAAIHG